MDTAQIRKDSFATYKSLWKPAVIMCAIYMGVSFIVGLLSGALGAIIGGLLMIAYYVVVFPLAYGLNAALWKVFKGETVGPIDFFTIGFNNFKRAWGVSLRTLLKLIIPVIMVVVGYILIAIGGAGLGVAALYTGKVAWWAIVLMILGGGLTIAGSIWAFIAGLYYSLASIIAIDDESADTKTCVERSKELMNGKRGKLFVAMLPTIGFFILVGIAASLVFFWNKTLLTLAQSAGYAFVLPLMIFTTFVFYNAVKNGPVEVKKEEVKEVKSEDKKEDKPIL